jgi:hypothetical protein
MEAHMVEAGQTSTEQPPKDLVGFLDYYLVRKAPFQIPDNVKEWLVQYGPWITIVVLVLTLPALMLLLGLGTALVPFGAVGYATGFGFIALGLVIEIGLTVMALPGLFARKMSGWSLLFYARLVSIVANLLAGAIVSALVVGVISLYVLFQVRPLYKA